MYANFGRAASGALLLAALVVSLAACNNGSSQSPNVGPTTLPGCGTLTANSRVYVTNGQGSSSSGPSVNSPNTIDIFTMGTILNGGSTISPCAQITSGSFSAAYGIALDGAGNIYVTDEASSTISEFGTAANGSGVTPLKTISSTNLGSPYGIALDGSGNIYVSAQGSGTSNNTHGAIFVFSPSASGSATPLRVIAGSNTGLDEPAGLAISGSTLYVTNEVTSTVLAFPITANGNVKPSRTISGTTSNLNSPIGVAARGGDIYVSNPGTTASATGSITVYLTTGTSSKPVRTITSASASGLFGPAGLALDGSNRLWVGEAGPVSSSSPTGVLAVYPSGANGAVSPTASVTGVGYSAWAVAVF